MNSAGFPVEGRTGLREIFRGMKELNSMEYSGEYRTEDNEPYREIQSLSRLAIKEEIEVNPVGCSRGMKELSSSSDPKEDRTEFRGI